MDYQKLINLIDNAPNQPSKFKTKNSIKIDDDLPKKYNTNSRIKFKMLMIESILCDYNDVYMLKEPQPIPNTAEVAAVGGPINRNKKMLKNCAPFADCTSEKKNTQLDNVKGIVIVMPVYNLIEYSDNYLKLFGSLLQYFRDEPVLNDAGAIIDFPDADINSASLKLKQKIPGQSGNDGTKDIQIMVSFKYLSRFWKTL